MRINAYIDYNPAIAKCNHHAFVVSDGITRLLCYNTIVTL